MIRLLIIDEHHAVRTALELRLRSSSEIEVVATAQSLSDWQDLVQGERPDVVLFGLKSSRYRELYPTAGVVSQLALKGIPAVVLASYADDMERELLLESGARRYLLKDINTSQLIEEIKTVASEAVA